MVQASWNTEQRLCDLTQHVEVAVLEAIPCCQDLVKRFPRSPYHYLLSHSCAIVQVPDCEELLPMSSLPGGNPLSGTDSPV